MIKLNKIYQNRYDISFQAYTYGIKEEVERDGTTFLRYYYKVINDGNMKVKGGVGLSEKSFKESFFCNPWGDYPPVEMHDYL